MTEHVLRNSKLPNHPWVVDVPDHQIDDFLAAHEASGWRLAKTDPATIPDPPTVPPEDRAEPASNTKE